MESSDRDHPKIMVMLTIKQLNDEFYHNGIYAWSRVDSLSQEAYHIRGWSKANGQEYVYLVPWEEGVSEDREH